MLDLGDGYSRAHNLAGRGVGEGEDGALQHGPANLAVQFSQSVLVVLGDAIGAYQAAGGCGNLAAEGLQLARLARLASHVVCRWAVLFTSGKLSVKLESSCSGGIKGRGLVDLPRPGDPRRAEGGMRAAVKGRARVVQVSAFSS